MKLLKHFENYSKGSYQDWKRKIGLKISHAAPPRARYTVTSTNWGSDYSRSCRCCTGFPYQRILWGYDFSRATRDSSPQSKITFSATVHQTTLTTMVQSNVVPTFRLGAATTTKNGPTRYNTQDITTVSNKMLCSSNAAHSILTTICTYSNEFTNRSSNKGVFTSFQHVKLGFVPLSKFSSR